VSCVCLTAAGLLVRSALAVDRIDVGIDGERVVMGAVGLGDQGYTAATGSDLYRRLLADLADQPGVESAALEWHASLGAIRVTSRFSAGRDEFQSRYNVVSPRYFETLRIPTIAGRTFDSSDGSGGEPVAVINETFARRLGGGALGSFITMAGESTPRRVVGIVREAKYNGITEAAQPFAYLPIEQAYRGDVWVLLRVAGSGGDALLRDRLRRLDPHVALSDVRTLAEQIDLSRAVPRTSARVSAALGGIAVFLALVGIYGLLAASVDQRSRELSIRAALGASPIDIFRTVAVTGMALTVAGLALGMVASVSTSNLLAGMLYNVRPRDPLVFALVPVVILVVSTAAWLGPARRAAHASPLDALRGES
jgi:putative ABC transport system permease protein